MYNNIGLSTPRGSGTNGHIQANRSHLRARQSLSGGAEDAASASRKAFRAPDKSILEHERKRKVEVACLELQMSLEDDGVEQDEIDRRVGELRDRLIKAGATAPVAAKEIKPYQTHEFNQAKEERNETVRRAFGISKDHQEGIAFDKEKQEQLKIQRQVERAQAAEERAKIAKQLADEREKAAKAKAAEQSQAEAVRSRPLRPYDDAAPPSPPRDRPLPYDDVSRDAAPGPSRRRRDSRSESPPPRRSTRYESRSPDPRDARSSRRRSPSPPPRAGARRASPYARRSRSRSYSYSRSPSPPPRRRRSPSPRAPVAAAAPTRRGRSPSPYDEARRRERSPSSPPPRHRRASSPRRRSRSPSYSSMSYSSRSRSRSPRGRRPDSRSPSPPPRRR